MFFFSDSPRWMWWYHVICWLLSASGVICILVGHEHYSVDVVIAYFVTTRTFWTYHTMANTHVSDRESEVCEKTKPLVNYFFLLCFCFSVVTSGSKQLSLQDMVEPHFQLPGKERPDDSSHQVFMAGDAAVVLQAAVQDSGGREGRMRLMW